MMKKVVIGVAFAVVLVLGMGLSWYHYKQHRFVEYFPHNSEEVAEMAAFFAYAQEYLPNVQQRYSAAVMEPQLDHKVQASLQDELNLVTVLTLIAKRDVAGLQQLDAEQLEFDTELWVEGGRFHNADDKIILRLLSGDNALVYVLFHAMLDTNQQEREQTTAMLTVLLHKKLDVHAQGYKTYLVKEHLNDKNAHPYEHPTYVLTDLAILYGTPGILASLLQYGAPLPTVSIQLLADQCEIAKQQHKQTAMQDFVDVLRCYRLR